MLAAVLILAGIVLLVLGVVTSSTVLTAVALGLGVVAVVLLLLPLGRGATPSTEPAAAPETAKPKAATTAKAAPTAKSKAAAKPRPAKPKVTTPAAPPAVEPSTSAGAASVVLVVAGRHRFHRPGCELLDGKDTERLAPDEAAEEGFTACSRCRPTAAAVGGDGSAPSRI